MKLHLSDIKLENSVFSWKLNNYPFKITYSFPTNDRFLPIMKLIPIIQLSCLISSIKSVASVTADFELNLAEKLFIRKYVDQLHPHNINHLDTYSSVLRFPYFFTINGEDLTGKKYTNVFRQLKELNVSKPLHYEKEVISSWSGGKDSLLSILLLSEIGCTVFPGTTKWNTIAFNRGAAPYMEAHTIKPFYVASLALGNKLKNLTNEVINSEMLNKDMKLNLKEEFKGDVALPMILYHSFYMQTQTINNLVFALYKNLRYVFCGDEYGVNGNSDFGHLITNIGQSITGKRLVNRYIATFYSRAPTANSILYPLHGEAEVYLLINKYHRKDFTSCLTMIDKYCNRCAKCALTFLILQALGEDPEEYGLKKKKLIKEFKDIKRTSMMLPAPEERAWLIKRNFHDKSLNKILQNFATDLTEDSMLDPLLPEKEEYKTIPKYYRKKLVEIYEELNYE